VCLDPDRLERALSTSIAGVTSADEAYTAVCACLRSELGDELLASVYVADEDRLWLSAQRGYDQVVHTHSPGTGLFTKVHHENRPLAVAHSVRDDPSYIEVVHGIESLAAAPFSARVHGIVGIESRVAIDEADGLAIVERAARTIETALNRLSPRENQGSSARLRLLRAVSALASAREPLAILELLARSVGDALGLDLVQAALAQDGLEPSIVWSRSRDRARQLDGEQFRAQAGRFSHELVIGSDGAHGTVVGLPLNAAGELVGYLVGVCGTRGGEVHERIDEALVVATTAAQSLAGLNAERDRERAEQRFHAVVESLSEGLIVLSLDGRMISANASAHRILGHDADALIGRRPEECLSFFDERGDPLTPSERAGSITLLDGEPRTGVLMGVQRQDGELRWIEENTRGLRSPEGDLDAVVITFADVTERFVADRRVRSERDFTARVLNTIADGVLVTDELPDGGRVIVHVNDRICEITGFPREQLLGARTPFPWWPEDRHEELASAFADATMAGSGEYEALFQRRDGSALPAMVSVETAALAGAQEPAWVITVKDLSQRNALLEDLQTSRADMQRVLESVEEYLYTYELSPDGTSALVRELSRPVARILASDTPGCVGTDERWLAATHPDDRAGVDEAARRLLADRPVDYEHRVRDRDGVERWMWVRERPERTADGRLLVHGAMTDVTARKWAEGQLGEALEDARNSYAELSALHDQMQRIVGSIDQLFYTDELRPDGSWHSNLIGDNFRRFIGDVEDGVDPQKVWDDAVHPEDRELYDAVDARVLALEAVDLEYRLVGRDGGILWVWERMRPSGRRPDGTLVVDGVVQDITERKRAEERLEDALALAEQARLEADQASRTDPLTGLANRRDFAEQLGCALESTRPGQALGLLLLDIDHFKRTNDTYGHAAGDAVLREVARQLASVVRSGDIVARIGGEELAVVMPGGGGPDVLRLAGERVRMLVAAATVRHDDCDVPFTVSVGAASSLDAATPDTLLASADRAMYAAKRRGRDRVCLFSELVGDDFLAEVPEALRIAEALALTVSVREGMPALHNQQVAELAGAIAVELRLPPQEVLRCQVSGWLHDIGKTAIPDSILAKPGELTEEEWAQMRRLPESGEASG
jgi:diguanylate cyclase (GGDEF)-like protein/PAS domain S-box-containing protein